MKAYDFKTFEKFRKESNSQDFLQDIPSLVSLSYNQKPLNSVLEYNLSQVRSLILDFCDLSSFEGFPQIPNLNHLSLVGNKIQNFSGIPIYPMLLSIDLSANPICSDKKLITCAIGSIQLQKINGEEMNSKTSESAFKLPPVVGYALRRGRMPKPQIDEVKASLEYLSSEPPLTITQSNGVQYISTESESPTSNWYMYTNDGSWTNLKAPVRALPITPAVTLKLIKCEFEKNGSIVESYLPKPVGWDGESPISIYNEEPAFVGDVVEGGIVLANTQKECRIIWKLNNEIISTDPCLEIPLGSYGKSLAMTVSPISFAFPEIQFAGLTQEFTIEAPELEIISFKLPEQIVEGEAVDVFLETYPPNSDLEINIQTAQTIESEFTNYIKGKKFVPGRDIIGRFVRATVDVNGSIYCTYSLNPVLPKPEAPIIIDGAYITNHPHVILFEDDSLVNSYDIEWILVKDGHFIDQNCNEKIFYPPPSAAGSKLAVRLIPKDISRAPQLIFSKGVLKEGAPLLDTFSQRPIEGRKLQMAVGGHWLLSGAEGFSEVATGQSYTPTADDVGRYLRFCAEQVDSILGVVQRENSSILSVELRCDGTSAGSLVFVSAKLSEPEGGYEVEWYRCSRGQDELLVQRGGGSYALSVEDVGSKVKARVLLAGESKDSRLTPIVRSGPFKARLVGGEAAAGGRLSVPLERHEVRWSLEGADGEYEEIAEGPVCPLVLSDRGRRIRCEVEMKKSTYYEVVSRIGEAAVEVGTAIKNDQIFRKVTRKSDLKWYRSNYEKRCWVEINRGPSYVLTKDDIGCVIRVDSSSESALITNIVPKFKQTPQNPQIYPTQRSKESEMEMVMEIENEEEEEDEIENENETSNGPKLIQSRDGSLAIVGFAGSDPEFVWRIWRDGQCNYIDNGTNERLVLLPIMIGCEIEGGVRIEGSDEVEWTVNKIRVERALPQPEGELVEKEGLSVGASLLCRVTTNRHVHYSWKRWDGSQFIHIVDNTNKYTLSEDDVDCYVCCDVQYVDDDGFVGPALTVRTSGVIPPPSLLLIEGEPVVGEEIVPAASDGFLDGASMCWQRCDAVGWSDVSSRATYRLTVEDIGCVIRLVATNVDEQRVSQEVGPVEGPEDVVAHAEEMVSSGSLRWHGKDLSGVTYALDANAKYLVVKGRGPQSSHPWKNVVVSPSGRSKVRIKLGNSTLKLTPISSNAFDIESEAVYRDCVVLACNMLKNGSIKLV